MKYKLILLVFAVFITLGFLSSVQANSINFTQTNPTTPFDSLSGLYGNKGGMQIYVNSNISLFNVSIASGTNATTAYVLAANKTALVNATITNKVAQFNGYTLLGGATYYIAVDAPSSSYVSNYSSTASYPYAGTFVNWTGGLDLSTGSDTSLYGFAITNITYGVNASAYFTLCDPTFNVPFLNITFKNETGSQNNVNASITSAFTYWVNGDSQNSTYTLTNATENYKYAFCVSPSTVSLNVIPSINYYNSISPQRDYNPGILTLTNATTNTTLFLLPTSAGIYVTFQVTNAASNALAGATVAIQTGGTSVASGTTDSSGTVTFFLNPLTSYTITISKTGYPVLISSITPAQSQYTFVLGSSTISVNTTDLSQGISAQVQPFDQYISNNTIYNFNFSLNSSTLTIQSFGFTLYDQDGNTLSSNSSSNNGGIVYRNQNTSNLTQIVMNYYYQVNNTYQNFTRVWVVTENSGSGVGITNLITDLQTYLSQGIFGLTSFGLNIIVFLIIFVGTGIFAYKFALTSPGAVLGVMAGLTILFDVGLNLITYADPIPNHAASMILTVAAIAFVIKEALT